MKKLFLMMFVMIFLMGIVSANVEFNDKLTYSKNDLKVSLDNWWGIGKTIGTIELKSHESITEVRAVMYGKDRAVMYYDSNFPEKYSNGLGIVTFKDMNTNEEVDKDYYFAKAIYKDVPIYTQICEDIKDKEGEDDHSCYGTPTGKTEKQFSYWEKLSNQDIPSGEVRIALITDVNIGDYYDAIWTIAGKEITKHAEWTESLNTGLIAYYPMNASSGNDVFNQLKNNSRNGTYIPDVKTVSWVSGLLGNAINFGPANNDKINMTYSLEFPNGTINFWANPEVLQSSWIGNDDSGSPLGEFRYISPNQWRIVDSGGAKTLTADTTLQVDTYTMITITWNSTGYLMYLNGTLQSTYLIADQSPLAQDRCWAIGGITGNACISVGNHNGTIDEFGIWNIELTQSQVTQLYNDGTGITYSDNFGDNTAPRISVTFPPNNTNQTSSSVIFSGNATDDIFVKNVSLYINNLRNQSNTSVFNNSQTNFTEEFSDGTYDWYYEAYDNSSNRVQSSGMRFSIDTIKPKLNVTSPHGDFYQISGNSIDLDWNITEPNLDVCRYEYKGVNTTVTCSDNTTTISGITDVNNVTLIFYSNDSVGNTNNTVVTWNYSLFENDRGSRNSTIEGAIELYYLDFTIKTGSLSTARMWYEGNETDSSFSSPSNRRYNSTLSNFLVPETDVNKVVNFFWEVSYGDTQVNTTTSSQHINAFTIDDCGTNTNVLYNFTILNEQTQTNLNGSGDHTVGNLNLNITGYSSNAEVISFNSTYNATNPFAVCLNVDLSGIKYNINTEVSYEGKNFFREFYHIQNDTLDNSDLGTNISLYDLDNSSGLNFKIIFKDGSFLPIENALIEVQRKYIGEGKFKVVEILKTDHLGSGIAHLETDDVAYTFLITKFGKVLGTFSNQFAFCPNPTLKECKIELSIASSTLSIDDFTLTDDFSFSIQYNKDTKEISVPFTSSSTSTVLLNATKFDSLGSEVACSQSLSTKSGTLTCTIPSSFGNSTSIVRITRDGELMGQGTIAVKEDPKELYGANQVFVSIIILLTLIGIGIVSNPIVTIILLVVGVVFTISLNVIYSSGFIGSTATILFLVIAVVILLIKSARRT